MKFSIKILLLSGCLFIKTFATEIAIIPQTNQPTPITNLSTRIFYLNNTISKKEYSWGTAISVVIGEEYTMGSKKVIDGRDSFAKYSSLLIACSGADLAKPIAVEWEAYYDTMRRGNLIKKIDFGLTGENFQSLARAIVDDGRSSVSEQGITKLCKLK